MSSTLLDRPADRLPARRGLLSDCPVSRADRQRGKCPQLRPGGHPAGPTRAEAAALLRVAAGTSGTVTVWSGSFGSEVPVEQVAAAVAGSARVEWDRNPSRHDLLLVAADGSRSWLPVPDPARGASVR